MSVARAVLFRLATNQSFERAVRAAPGGERVAWRAASRYVAGRSRDQALTAAAALLARGCGVSVDVFGERVSDPDTADRVVAEYVALIGALPAGADAWVSVDLTHLALETDPTGTADRLGRIASQLGDGRRVQVGAEDARHTDAVIACLLDVAARGLSDRLGATVQANLHRSWSDVDALVGARIHVRLVKGAYLETAGVHPYGEPTDVAFLRLGFRLAELDAAWSMATHDVRLREALLLGLGQMPVEQLLGVRPAALDELRQRRIPTRVYVPYGSDWFRYWMRRVAESRGAG